MKKIILLSFLLMYIASIGQAQTKYRVISVEWEDRDKAEKIIAKSPLILTPKQKESLMTEAKATIAAYDQAVPLEDLSPRKRNKILKAKAIEVVLQCAPDYYRKKIIVKPIPFTDENLKNANKVLAMTGVKYNLPEFMRSEFKREREAMINRGELPANAKTMIGNQIYEVTFKFLDEEKDKFYNDGFKVYLADQTGDFINAFVPTGIRISYYNLKSPCPYGNIYMLTLPGERWEKNTNEMQSTEKQQK